jgi:DNA-binding IclR family transcriptional regulator
VDHTVSGVGVVDKTVRILEVLSDGRPRSLGELVTDTELPRATAHRLAHALQAHGLTHLGPDDRWGIGARVAQLARSGGEPVLASVARPILEHLRDVTGESAQLYIERAGSRLCVLTVESGHGLRTIVPLGAVLPLDAGSGGRVLRGESVPRRGWLESVEERERGVASVSAPVRRDGAVLAAVSVSGPVERTTRQPGRRYGAAVAAAARAIEGAVGW